MGKIEINLLPQFSYYQFLKFSNCPRWTKKTNYIFKQQVLKTLDSVVEDSVSARMMLHSLSREKALIRIHPHDLNYHLDPNYPDFSPTCIYTSTKSHKKAVEIVLCDMNRVSIFPSKESQNGVTIFDSRISIMHELLHAQHYLNNSIPSILDEEFTTLEERLTILGSANDSISETQIAHELGLKGRSTHCLATREDLNFEKFVSFDPVQLLGKQIRPTRRVEAYEATIFSLGTIFNLAFGYRLRTYNEIQELRMNIASPQFICPFGE